MCSPYVLRHHEHPHIATTWTFPVFYAISHEPSTSLIRSQAQTDPGGYILTILGTTSAFAAGDVQNNGYREAVDGCD